jgi:hypothetical protein
MGIEYGIGWTIQYLLVATWVYVAHSYGNELRKSSSSRFRALGAILLMSFTAAFVGGGILASYQPNSARAHGVIAATFLVSFIPAILDGPGTGHKNQKVQQPAEDESKSVGS